MSGDSFAVRADLWWEGLSKDKKIKIIREDIAYEGQPGVHTYHMCEHCNSSRARRAKCATCLREELRELEE